MTMKSKILGLLAAIALSVAIGQTANAQEILLGNLSAGAGPFATLAKTIEIAAQMAVEEINASGGVGGKKLKIISFDTAGKPEQAVIGVRKLAEDNKVMAIIGPFSSSEARVAERKEAPSGWIGVGAGPDAAIRLAQELRRQGHKGRLVAGSTIADSELAIRMGANGNGTVIPTTFFGGVSDKAKAFEAEFVKRAKAAGVERTGASQFDAATYDIVLFYAHAMKEGKITGDPAKLADERTKVRDILRAMPPYPALEGPISFGKNGDALKPVYIIEMQDGKWNLIGTPAPGA